MSENEQVSHAVEVLCECGCDAVRQTIRAIEQGEQVAALDGLAEEQRGQVLAELRSVMAVYDRG